MRRLTLKLSTVMRRLDRFHLGIDACSNIENECKAVKEKLWSSAVYFKQEIQQMLIKHKNYIWPLIFIYFCKLISALTYELQYTLF